MKISDFTPATQCADCHSEIYQQWRNSAHSRAATDSIFQKMLPAAQKDLGELGIGFCLKCHTPIATVTKEVRVHEPVELPLRLSPIAMEGVTCDFCHTFSGQENFGKDISPGIYVYPRKGQTDIKYGVHKDASTANHLTQVSKFLQSAEYCGICHKFPHPFDGENVQDTYTEWKYGPYGGKQGQQCQSCHMQTFNGQSAIGGPIRTNLHAHFFPGGSSELVRKAATVTVSGSISKNKTSPRVLLKVVVKNVGAGHSMPTGLPGLRQMWVAANVRDANGQVIYTNSASIGKEGLDAAGRPTMPWNAATFTKDTRVGPQKSIQWEWDFPFAAPANGELEIEAGIYYRSLSPLAAEVAGVELPPATLIAANHMRLFLNDHFKETPNR